MRVWQLAGLQLHPGAGLTRYVHSTYIRGEVGEGRDVGIGRGHEGEGGGDCESDLHGGYYADLFDEEESTKIDFMTLL